MFNRTRTISTSTGLRGTGPRRGHVVLMAAAATALAGAGVLASVAPASAVVLDTDHPKVNSGLHAFGTNWVAGAPINGGDTTWDLTNGITTVSTQGYHYLEDGHCGRVLIEYFNGSHTEIGEDVSSTTCAAGNGKTQWWVSESFSSSTVSHVHVSVQHHNGGTSYTTLATDNETFD